MVGKVLGDREAVEKDWANFKREWAMGARGDGGRESKGTVK
jgi:hypothetical protein